MAMSGMNRQRVMWLLAGIFIGLVLSMNQPVIVDKLAHWMVRQTPVSQAAQTRPVATTQPVKYRFVVLGDGGSGLTGQKQIAAQMWKLYQERPYPLVLMLGDNIYPDGDVNKYGQERFMDPYALLLNRNVKFKAVLGNHDVLFGFKNDSIRFFKMPGAYYDYSHHDICFYALDTNAFDATQQAWLERRLRLCRQPWRIVYGHHPVYSSGLHGNSQALMNDLKPLLEKYHVQFYLAGHDHDYERFRLINGVQYIVSGGGGASIREFKAIVPESVFRFSKHHLMVFDRLPNAMHFRVISAQGELMDQGDVPLGKY